MDADHGPIPPPTMSKEDLKRLLTGPLGRLRIQLPDDAACAELAVWTGRRPSPFLLPEKRTRDISAKPHRHMTAFANSLTEVEAFWQKVLEFTISQAPSGYAEEMIKRSHQTEVAAPLQRLKSAMLECEALIEEHPKDFRETWELTAQSLHAVFGWIVARSGSSVSPGLSKGGPGMTFVMSGLNHLGWLVGAKQPTEDAVLQFLKRLRKSQTKEGQTA